MTWVMCRGQAVQVPFKWVSAIVSGSLYWVAVPFQGLMRTNYIVMRSLIPMSTSWTHTHHCTYSEHSLNSEWPEFSGMFQAIDGV